MIFLDSEEGEAAGFVERLETCRGWSDLFLGADHMSESVSVV